MICPSCLSQRCSRSRRQGIKDYTIGFTGLRPWRCAKCKHRFFAKAVPLKFAMKAHCNQCGNFDLQRISNQHVTGWFSWIPRLLRVPAYRCAPCRNRFFSLRRKYKVTSAKPSQSVETPDAPEQHFARATETADQGSLKATPPSAT